MPHLDHAVPSTLERSSQALYRRCADRVLVATTSADRVLTLMGTGIALWDALEAPTTRDGLCEDMASKFGAPRDRVECDLDPLLADLIAAGIVILGTSA